MAHPGKTEPTEPMAHPGKTEPTEPMAHLEQCQL